MSKSKNVPVSARPATIHQCREMDGPPEEKPLPFWTSLASLEDHIDSVEGMLTSLNDRLSVVIPPSVVNRECDEKPCNSIPHSTATTRVMNLSKRVSLMTIQVRDMIEGMEI